MSDKKQDIEKKAGWLSRVFAPLGYLTRPSKKLVMSYSFDKKGTGTLTTTTAYGETKREVPTNTSTWLEARRLDGMGDLYKIVRIDFVKCSEAVNKKETPEIIGDKKALTFGEALAALKDFDDQAMNDSDSFDAISTPQKRNVRHHWTKYPSEKIGSLPQKGPEKKDGESTLERLKKQSPKPPKND